MTYYFIENVTYTNYKSTMQDMIENTIPTLEYLHNCDDLKSFFNVSHK